MHLTDRSNLRTNAVQRSTVIGWYLGAGLLLCLAGAIWLASALGMLDFLTESHSEASRPIVKAAAHKSAEQQRQARLAAEEEARNIAADANRLVVAPATVASSPAAATEPTGAPPAVAAPAAKALSPS